MRKLSPRSYPGELKVFILASLINSTGSALMWPLTTLYVHTQFGRSLADAGFAILIQSLGGIIGQLLGGGLYHKAGVKTLLVGSLCLASAMQFSLMFGGGWTIYLCTLALIGLSTSVSLPAIQAFIGFRWAERRNELFNTIYVWNNVGVAVGTALAGVLADISFRLTFGLNGLSSLLFAVFFYVYLGRIERRGVSLRVDFASNTVNKPTRGEKGLEMKRLLLNYKIYAFVGIGSLLIWFGNSIWGSGIAPFLYAQGLGLSAYSLLWTLNGLIIFFGQPVTTLLKRLALRSVYAHLTAGAAFYCVGFILVLFYREYPGMIAAMALITIGEMLFQPAVPAFVAGQAGVHSPFYLGLVGGIGSVGRLFGPYSIGLAYDYGGIVPAGWIAVLATALAVGAFAAHALLLKHKRAEGSISMGT